MFELDDVKCTYHYYTESSIQKNINFFRRKWLKKSDLKLQLHNHSTFLICGGGYYIYIYTYKLLNSKYKHIRMYYV